MYIYAASYCLIDMHFGVLVFYASMSIFGCFRSFLGRLYSFGLMKH